MPCSGLVNQTATSIASVSNAPTTSIMIGDISGTGASARASATGVATSVSVTSILSAQSLTFGFSANGITQTSINTGVITNTNVSITAGTLSGMASSVAINATGASASVAMTSIADTTPLSAPISVGSISQTVTNNPGSVLNTGTITLAGGITGVGAAASISAIGASASVSYLAVR